MKIEQVKSALKKLPHDQFWQIGEQTGHLLKDTVEKLNAKTVLEIGTSSGYSALWIIEGLIKTGGHLYTIESHTERFQIAQKSFEDAEVTKYVSQIKGHAPECIPDINFASKIDVAFIDATKKQTTEFLTAISTHLNDKAIVFVDNALSHKAELEPFVHYLDSQNIKYLLHDFEAGVLEINI